MIKRDFSLHASSICTACKFHMCGETIEGSIRSVRFQRSTAGFTMIEALAALAIVAIALAAIGSLVAFNVRGTARLERQLASIASARAILASAAARSRTGAEVQSGEFEGNRWEIRSRSLRQYAADGLWVPRLIAVTVRSPDGRQFQLETIGLRRQTGGGG